MKTVLIDDMRSDIRALAVGYPHEKEAVWSQFISVPEEEVDRIFDKWRGDAVI